MKTTLTITLFFLLPTILPGQQPLRFTPVFRNYTTEQGLPSNETFAILQDQKGYMWFSTNHGVCRFNGYEFEQFPDTLQANYNSVMSRSLTEDACGRIWWADFIGRVFYEENGRIIPWQYNHRLDSLRSKFNYINSLIVGDCGENIWVACNDFGILHVDKYGVFRLEPKPNRAATVMHIFEGKDGFMVNRASPLNTPKKQSPLRYIYKDGYYSVSLRFDYTSKIQMGYFGKLSNNQYFLGWGNYIFLFQGLELLWKRQYDKEVVWHSEDSDGSILLGQQRGGGVRQYASLDDLYKGNVANSFLEGLSISNIFKDREGGYWFASQENGLYYTPSLKSGIAGGTLGVRGEMGKGVVFDGLNHLYFGTQNGQMFDLDLQSQTAKKISPGTISHLFALYYDEKNQALICPAAVMSSYHNRKWLVKGAKWNDNYKSTPIICSRMAFDRNPNYYWLACAGSVVLYDWKNESKIEHSLDSLKALVRFNSISVDANGRVWTSTNTGLYEYKNARLLSPVIKHPVFLNPTNDIQLLPDSSLVFCPKGYGVAFWNPDSGKPPHTIGEAQGLVFNKVDRLFLEPEGAVWACTERGASRISADRQHIESFTVKTGLPSNRVSQVAMAHGYYWLATSNGLFRMAGKLPEAPIPIPLLEAIDIYGVRYPIGNSIQLPHDSSNITIKWVALHYRSNADIEYRYRLIINDGRKGWSNTKDRQVSFPKLLPGSYRFEVQAQDENGNWGDTAAQEFYIRHPWYTKRWVRSLFVLSLFMLVFGLYRYRLYQIQKEGKLNAEMIKLERAALQAQMSPHFIFNCLNSIQDFILNNNSNAAVLYLAKFAKLVRGTLNASVAGVVSLEEETHMLDNYLALERLRFDETFDYQISVDGMLDIQKTLLPPLIVQPFVENAVLHGMKDKKKGGQIRIIFQQEKNSLCIRISDNGPGFREVKPAGKKQSHGRSITQRRIELLQRMNAKQEISVEYLVAENPNGTTILITLPLKV